MIGMAAFVFQQVVGGGTPERPIKELSEIRRSYGSTDSRVQESRDCDVFSEIDSVVQDPDNYEAGEPRPSREAIEELKRLLSQAIARQAPPSEISTYYGEIDATWHKDNRMLRIVAYSDGRESLLYFCADSGDALTRGETIQPVSADDISQKLTWLIG
jgi:hypothetical protein